MPVTTTTVLTENTLNLLQFPIYYSRIYAFLEQFLHHNTHYYGKICVMLADMLHLLRNHLPDSFKNKYGVR